MTVNTAEYLLGPNKIVYKAREFATGLTVTCFLWDTDLERTGPSSLTELSNGLYFFNHDFNEFGIHHGVFLENGVETTFQSFRVRFREGQSRSRKTWGI